MYSLLALLQQTGGGGAAQPGGGGMNMLVMMGLMGGIIYFMMIRPQQKKAKQHEAWLKSLKKGDEVVTQGGIVGRISGITDQFVTLEIQEKVRIKVLRGSITGKPPELKREATTAQPVEDKK